MRTAAPPLPLTRSRPAAQGPTGTAAQLKSGHDTALALSCATVAVMGRNLTKKVAPVPAALVALGSLSGAFHFRKRSEWADAE